MYHTNALRKDALTETYQDMEGVMKDACSYFLKRYQAPVSFDEVFSECCLAFVEAFDNYQKDKASFSTYLVTRMRGRYKDLIRNRVRKNINALDIYKIDIEGRKPAESFWESIYLELSNDAQFVVELLIYTPSNLQKIINFKGGTSQNITSTIRKYLREIGWTFHKIKKTFDEIKRAIA